jgi:hypothetical protein
MAANSFATSVNTVRVIYGEGAVRNTQNARIHYDDVDTSGWTVAADGTLATGTDLRRSVLDSADKSAPTDALDSDVGVAFTYVALQNRSVKKVTGSTAARIVFSPAHL